MGKITVTDIAIYAICFIAAGLGLVYGIEQWENNRSHTECFNGVCVTVTKEAGREFCRSLETTGLGKATPESVCGQLLNH